MRAFLSTLCLLPLLACLPWQAQAQYTGGIGRGDAQLAFVPDTNVGLAPMPQAAHASLHGWPVPTTGLLQLDRVVTATLHDATGRIVGTVQRTNTLDASGLPPGAYVLRTERGEVVRFIRE